MDIYKILEELEDLIQRGKRVPMTGKVLVSEEAVLSYLDQIRAIFPEELHQAKVLNKERERIIQEAREEAERILSGAREEARRLVSENEVTRQAQAASEEIVSQAKRLAREIKNGAADYTDEMLGKLEHTLDQNLAAVRKAREELSAMK